MKLYSVRGADLTRPNEQTLFLLCEVFKTKMNVGDCRLGVSLLPPPLFTPSPPKP